MDLFLILNLQFVVITPGAPMRGIAYGALPCKHPHCSQVDGYVSEDMVQEAYEKEWGSSGRDDLSIMAHLGANVVRLYHSLGLDMKSDHGAFLDHAQEVGLSVLPGFHSYAPCPEHNCYETWKQATLDGFQHGYLKGNDWHPAILALILLNEPDFFGSPQERMRLMLSAVDGVLAAEKMAGVRSSRVQFSITWSFGVGTSVDGKVTGPGIFGFQDALAGFADPTLADYVPRCDVKELQNVFKTRWVNGVNVQAPWDYVKAVIYEDYRHLFGSTPWFIGEYGANGQTSSTIQRDLEDMEQLAYDDPTFVGSAFFQFQTAYFKTGSELNFGMFSLGDQKLYTIVPDKTTCPACADSWPVYCLSPNLPWLPGSAGNRVEAVAAAWGGSAEPIDGYCGEEARRLFSFPRSTPLVSTYVFV